MKSQISKSLHTKKGVQKLKLMNENKLHTTLDEYFIIQPSYDGVSKDFCWVEKLDNKIIIAVAGTTGQRTPGDLMNLIGINLLRKIVLQDAIISPSKILTEIHDYLRKPLYQNQSGSPQELDIGIVLLEKIKDQETLLVFSGARRPLYYIDKNEHYGYVSVIEGANKSVGGFQNESISFENHGLWLSPGSMIYLSNQGVPGKSSIQTAMMNCLMNVFNCCLRDQKEALLSLIQHKQDKIFQVDMPSLILGLRT